MHFIINLLILLPAQIASHFSWAGPLIMRLIVGRGIRLMMLGLGLGLVGSVAAARILATQLPGVSAGDPLVFAGAALLLGAVAFVASWLPARRATKTDPMDALRAE